MDLIDNEGNILRHLFSNIFLEEQILNFYNNNINEIINEPLIKLKSLEVRYHKIAKNKFLDCVISVHKNEEIQKQTNEIQ